MGDVTNFELLSLKRATVYLLKHLIIDHLGISDSGQLKNKLVLYFAIINSYIQCSESS